METSLLVAKILGLVYLVVGIGLLANPKYYHGLLTEMRTNPFPAYFGGLLALVFGAILVNYHNFWVKDWTVIITVLGWLALVKGICLLMIPKMMLGQAWLKSKNLMIVGGVFALLLGLFFCYQGFVA